MRRGAWIVALFVVALAVFGEGSAMASGWRLQPTPLPAGGATSLVLNGVSCSGPRTCTAVGSYMRPGSTVTLAEAWNGTSWTLEATPNPAGATSSVLNSVSCTSAGACIAVGSYVNSGSTFTLAEAWNGASWTIQTTVNPTARSALNGVSCTAADACTAVGSSGPTPQTLAEAWDGTSWSLQATPNNLSSLSGSITPNSLSGISCVSSSSCIAVGQWTDDDVNADTCPAALVWDGSTWQEQTPQCPGTNPAQMMGPDAGFSSVSCTATGACTAVGNYFDSSDQMTLAERLTGSAWTVQSTPNQTGSFGSIVPNVLSGTSCSGPHSCESVGSFVDQDVNSDVCPVAMGWNGAVAWNAQQPRCPGSNHAAMQGPNALFNGVSCTAELACTAVGYFFDASRQRALVERYSR